MRHPALALSVLVLAPLASPAGGAESPAPSLAEMITVELVNVEVRVLDAGGQPVAGLSAADFEVREDGRPVAISHFAWVPAAEAAAASAADTGHRAAAAAGPAAPLHLTVLFDELQTGERSRGPLLDALGARLRSTLAPRDRVTVLRFDGAEVEVLLDASEDRGRLAEALASLGAFSTRRLLSATEVRSALAGLADDIAVDNCQHTNELLRMYASSIQQQVKSSAAALLRAAQRFDPAPGRKVLLHVSDGIPMVAGGEAYEYAIEMCDGRALSQGISGAFDVAFDGADQVTVRDRFDPNKARLDFTEFSTAKLWTDVAARVNALGVTIYTVQAGDSGERFLPGIEGGHASAVARSTARQNPRDTLAFLANETGGLMIDANGNETAGVERFAGDLGGYYSLAFAPRPDARAGLRTIRVDVAREGVRLRHRQSYRLQTTHERIAGQLLVLFDTERVENPLGLRLAIEDSAVEAPAATRTARLSVPLENLVLVDGERGARSGRLTLFLTMRRANGSIVPVRQRTLDVVLPPPPPAGNEPAESYTYAVALPAEAREVAAALLDEFSGRMAYVRSAGGR